MEAAWDDFDHACTLEVSAGWPPRITVQLPGRLVQPLAALAGIVGIAIFVSRADRRKQ